MIPLTRVPKHSLKSGHKIDQTRWLSMRVGKTISVLSVVYSSLNERGVEKKEDEVRDCNDRGFGWLEMGETRVQDLCARRTVRRISC